MVEPVAYETSAGELDARSWVAGHEEEIAARSYNATSGARLSPLERSIPCARASYDGAASFVHP